MEIKKYIKERRSGISMFALLSVVAILISCQELSSNNANTNIDYASFILGTLWYEGKPYCDTVGDEGAVNAQIVYSFVEDTFRFISTRSIQTKLNEARGKTGCNEDDLKLITHQYVVDASFGDSAYTIEGPTIRTEFDSTTADEKWLLLIDSGLTSFTNLNSRPGGDAAYAKGTKYYLFKKE